MNKDIFTEELGKLFNREPDYLVKKKHGHTPNISFKQLCENIYLLDSIDQVCSKFNITKNTIKNPLKNAFEDFSVRKGQKWRVELLKLIGYKKCYACSQDLPLNDFYPDKYQCINCTKLATKQFREKYPEKVRAYNNERKAKLRSTSINADRKSLNKIYLDCPDNYDVDHIIPISRGGIHHPDNLCYLPSGLNRAKGAKLPKDVPEIMKHAIFPMKKEKDLE